MQQKYNQEEINQRTSDYICRDCGLPFLTKEQLEGGNRITTFHEAECGLCKERKTVTNWRHYNYLKL